MKSIIALTLLLLPAWAAAQTPGRLTAERWINLESSQSVLSLTEAAIATRAPDTRPLQSGADWQANQADRYGVRLRGLVIPPLTGAYRFSVAADDAAELWLSPDASRFTKVPVASTRCATGARQWDKYPSQTSREFTLQAGQSYYIEGLMKENSASDHFSLGWSWQPPNWALAANGAVARQSSTRAAGGEASRAIDGDTNGHFFNGNSVTHTNSEANSWWEVEFSQLRPLNRVVLWNRTDGWGSRLSNFRVSVLDAAGLVVAGQAFFPPGSGGAGASLVWDLPATVHGKRVRVALLGNNNDGNGILSLAEVQVTEQVPAVTNWALAANGSTATQSATAYSGYASRAIDGNTNGAFGAGSITHTANTPGSWWQVDFRQDRPVNRVVLWNRVDAGPQRLSNFRVSVHNAAGAELAAQAFFPPGTGNVGERLVWDIGQTLPTARRVKIALLGNNNLGDGYLSLAEVEASQYVPGGDLLATNVIPRDCLASLPADPLDADDDNLPDAWETAHGLSATSAVGNHGPYGDPDKDGISNFDEFRHGADPQAQEALGNGLTREAWHGLGGASVADLTGNRARFLSWPDERVHAAGVDANTADTAFGARYRGTLTAPATGDYTLWLSGDDSAELWLADGSIKDPLDGRVTPLYNRFGKQRVATVPSATALHDFDRFASQRSRSIHLDAGQDYYIEVLHKQDAATGHVALAWQIPGQARAIIAPQFFTTEIPESADQDDDNLPDVWETARGLNPADNGLKDDRDGQRGDRDNDGLDNLAEFQLGTDPANADTDGDGYSDSEEAEIYGSNPLVADATQAGEPAADISGMAFSAAGGNFFSLGASSGFSTDRRGWVEFTFSLPGDGSWVFEVTGRARGEILPLEELPMDVWIDGVLMGRHTLKSVEGGQGSIRGLTPWLAAGPHVLRVFNANTYASVPNDKCLFTIRFFLAVR